MTAEDVKRALLARHPSEGVNGGPGQWTCLAEWMGIDLIAFDAWRKREVVAYEVKVSRGDLRRELLRPDKRQAALRVSTRFFFAVPAGLLTDEEVAWQEPTWLAADFERERCPGIPSGGRLLGRRGTRSYGGPCSRRRRRGAVVRVPVPVVLREGYYSPYQGEAEIPCPRCEGRGWVRKSIVEEVAPTLWLPRECGLVEVSAGRCTVRTQAPRRTPGPLPPHLIAPLVRWASFRPDPRH